MAEKLMTSSCVRPAAEKIVIKAGQADNVFTVADLPPQALDGGIEFEQHGAGGFVPYHALNPEKGRPAAAARHRGDMMTAGGGIEHQVAGRQLDRVTAERVLDHQLAAFVIARIGAAVPSDGFTKRMALSIWAPKSIPRS